MVAIGHLIGYAVGSIDMVRIFGTTLGDTQFKQMTVIAGLSLIGTVLITSYAVQERILVSARLVRN
jgi:solute carrier family 45, member 1/2/4